MFWILDRICLNFEGKSEGFDFVVTDLEEESRRDQSSLKQDSAGIAYPGCVRRNSRRPTRSSHHQ
jgi:hypothetical protein